MKKIYLVRHGQANSLGANYDMLTELGHKQATLLGEYFVRMKVEFDFIGSGSLNRQIQTLEGIINPLIKDGYQIPSSQIIEELNEFDSGLWLNIANAIRKEDNEFAKTLDRYKILQAGGRPSSRDIFYKLIQRVLLEWVEGKHSEPYSFVDYKSRVTKTLQKIPTRCSVYTFNNLLNTGCNSLRFILRFVAKRISSSHEIYIKYFLKYFSLGKW
jgi:broad specificity phosphatase PhoE